jgi:hypothetical protein
MVGLVGNKKQKSIIYIPVDNIDKSRYINDNNNIKGI